MGELEARRPEAKSQFQLTARCATSALGHLRRFWHVRLGGNLGSAGGCQLEASVVPHGFQAHRCAVPRNDNGEIGYNQPPANP